MLTGIEVKTINHLGIVAGIVDELEIVDIINQELGIDEQEIVNSGEIVKAIIMTWIRVCLPATIFISLLVRVPLRVDRARGRTAFLKIKLQDIFLVRYPERLSPPFRTLCPCPLGYRFETEGNPLGHMVYRSA